MKIHIPYHPLSYEEQLSRAEKLMGELLKAPVVKLDSYRQIKSVRSQLKDRIRKQKEEEKK